MKPLRRLRSRSQARLRTQRHSPHCLSSVHFLYCVRVDAEVVKTEPAAASGESVPERPAESLSATWATSGKGIRPILGADGILWRITARTPDELMLTRRFWGVTQIVSETVQRSERSGPRH